MLSPAKINLGLTVHHRRGSDGYHYLSSLFVPISFGDTITFSDAPSDTLVTTNLLTGNAYDAFEAVSERGEVERNLLWKTLALLRPSLSTGVRIELIKRIPPGSGLGGGSSNAGMLLGYLRDRFALSETTIYDAACKVGADVPFFLEQHAMFVNGIGELMEPIEIGNGFGVVALPPVNISTPEAYKQLKRSLHDAPPPKNLSGLDNGVRSALVASQWDRVTGLTNDFEGTVFETDPVLREIKTAFLEKGALYASLSGSGAALYGLVRTEADQQRIAAEMDSSFPDVAFHPFSIIHETDWAVAKR